MDNSKISLPTDIFYCIFQFLELEEIEICGHIPALREVSDYYKKKIYNENHEKNNEKILPNIISKYFIGKFDIIKYAINSNNIELVKWATEIYTYNEFPMITALEEGNISIIEYIYKKYCKSLLSEYIENALKSGSVNVMKWYIKKRSKYYNNINENILNLVAQFGNEAILIWIINYITGKNRISKILNPYSSIYKHNDNPILYVCERGIISMFEIFIKHGFKFNDQYITVIQENKLDFLLYLVNNNYIKNCSQLIDWGHNTNMIIKLIENNCPYNLSILITNTICNGNISLLKYLEKYIPLNGIPKSKIPTPYSYMENACEMGNYDIVLWLYKHGEKPTNLCRQLASLGNPINYQLINWLEEVGYN